jgi:hypothetical protein
VVVEGHVKEMEVLELLLFREEWEVVEMVKVVNHTVMLNLVELIKVAEVGDLLTHLRVRQVKVDLE